MSSPVPDPDLATLLSLAADTDAGVPRRRGRPRDDDDAFHARHLHCVFDLAVRGHTVEECCRLHGISRATCYRWLNRTRSCGCPECGRLRELLDAAGRHPSLY